MSARGGSAFGGNPIKHLRLKAEFSALNQSQHLILNYKIQNFKKMIHEQLPLPVPCYDLVLLTESSLGLLAKNFGYPQLA